VSVNEAAAVATAGVWVDQSAAAAASVTTNATQAASGAWAGFTGWYSAAAVASQAALLAQSSQAAQEAMVGIFSRYVAELIALLTDSRRVDVPRVRLQPVRNGVDPVKVHSRPAYVFRETFALTGDEYAAQERAIERAVQLIETDIMLAARQVQHDSMDELKVTSYRRVLRPELSESGPCGLCVVAANRVYTIKDLLPIHGRCKCETMPIVDGLDPGLTLNERDLKRLYEAAGGDDGPSTSAKDLKRVRVKVNEHGELGPVLTVRGHKFTGPDDLAENITAGADENRKRLAQLNLILGDFKRRDRAGEDLTEPIAFQQRLITDVTQRLSA
jgi:hypothetical protein